MDLKLLCPKCFSPLQDKHGAGDCKIAVGTIYFLTMECLECNEYFDIELSVLHDPRSKGTPVLEGIEYNLGYTKSGTVRLTRHS